MSHPFKLTAGDLPGAQAIYDRIARHLCQQRRRAVLHDVHTIGGVRCCYHLPDGRRCAVGCLIDPAHYRPELEQCNPDNIQVVRAVEASLRCKLSAADLVLLDRARGLHDDDLDAFGDDSEIPVRTIVVRLQWLAEEFGLTPWKHEPAR